MALQFIGDAGVYFPDRDVIKVNALAGDSLVECYATRSALAALGCLPSDTAQDLVKKFEARRIDYELAALAKYRRSLKKPIVVDITAEDIAFVLFRPHAA